jgi:hypothetical protein
MGSLRIEWKSSHRCEVFPHLGSLSIYWEGFPSMGSLAIYGKSSQWPLSCLGPNAHPRCDAHVVRPGCFRTALTTPKSTHGVCFRKVTLLLERGAHWSRQVIYHCCVVFLYVIWACTFRFSRRHLTVPDGSNWCHTPPTAPDVSRRHQLVPEGFWASTLYPTSPAIKQCLCRLGGTTMYLLFLFFVVCFFRQRNRRRGKK